MSYAIIRTGGRQFKVEPGKKYRLPTLQGEPGGKIEFTDVLLGNDGKAVKGADKKLAKAKVTGEIVRHGKGDKIIVFKRKRRKNHRRTRGHLQNVTVLRVTDILAKGQERAPRAEAAPAPEKTAKPKAAAKAKKPAAKKATAAKKAPAKKKPAAKKSKE